jgi:hypothetical protein
LYVVINISEGPASFTMKTATTSPKTPITTYKTHMTS